MKISTMNLAGRRSSPAASASCARVLACGLGLLLCFSGCDLREVRLVCLVCFGGFAGFGWTSVEAVV
ncbi:hypothetical protein, partial [Kitasatospora aureofaciens]|uniref:hypothetical protein n=1 Tax=Kitasatospora aureofaciens TaxID=1894 RepID=UPI0033DC5647